MKPTMLINKKTLHENLADYLEPHLQPHQGSNAYRVLADAMFEYLTATRDKRDEKRESLYHAKEMLEDYAYFEMKRKSGPSMKECGWGSL